MAVVAARRMAVVLTVLTVTAGCLSIAAGPASAIDTSRRSAIRHRLERRINTTRARHGLAPLTVNLVRLQSYAQDHARFMARKGYLIHDSPTALLREAPVAAVGYSENVGRTTRANAARALHRLFLRSPGHRANILDAGATQMGIGVVKRNGYVWVVQRFADVPSPLP